MASGDALIRRRGEDVLRLCRQRKLQRVTEVMGLRCNSWSHQAAPHLSPHPDQPPSSLPAATHPSAGHFIISSFVLSGSCVFLRSYLFKNWKQRWGLFFFLKHQLCKREAHLFSSLGLWKLILSAMSTVPLFFLHECECDTASHHPWNGKSPPG